MTTFELIMRKANRAYTQWFCVVGLSTVLGLMTLVLCGVAAKHTWEDCAYDHGSSECYANLDGDGLLLALGAVLAAAGAVVCWTVAGSGPRGKTRADKFAWHLKRELKRRVEKQKPVLDHAAAVLYIATDAVARELGRAKARRDNAAALADSPAKTTAMEEVDKEITLLEGSLSTFVAQILQSAEAAKSEAATVDQLKQLIDRQKPKIQFLDYHGASLTAQAQRQLVSEIEAALAPLFAWYNTQEPREVGISTDS